MLRLLYTAVFILASVCLYAQTLPLKRYSTADGLVSDRLTCMVQDQQGFIWTGSFFGLSRYDGYRFINISLPPVQQNKYVTSLVATDGAVYAGFLFGGGLLEYRLDKGTAFRVPAYKEYVFNDVLALCSHNKKGILVCAGGNAIYHFSDGQFRFLFALDSTYNNIDYRYLATDKKGNIWIATDKGLLVYSASGKLITVSSSSTFSLQPNANGVITASLLNGKSVISFLEIENGNAKIKRLADADAIVPVPQNNSLPDHLWLLDTSGRFINFSEDGHSTSFITKGVAGDDVHFLHSDRENNLWIATHTGLAKMPNLPTGFYPFEELANATGNITGNDSALWINNGRHLYLFRNDEIQKMERVESKFTGTLLYTGNELWIGNDNDGLLRLALNKNKIISSHHYVSFSKTKIRVHTITRDVNNEIWVCGANGIFYLPHGTPSAHFRPELQNGQPAFIVSMAVDAKKQTIWAGDNSNGILKIHYEVKQDSIRYSVQNYIDSSKGLTDGFIRSMLIDSKGVLWVGTRFGGIFRIQDDEKDCKVENLSKAAGLQCTRVTDIKEAGNKAIWFATCNGIYQYQPGSGKWNSFTTADGLQQAEIMANYVATDGSRCWAVSETGVTTMRLSGKNEAPPPLINLIRITMLGKEDSSAIFRNQAVVYKPNESSIGFQFAAASYTDEKKIWYKYRLQGFEETWSISTQSNSVNFASLPPGTYTFEVLATTDNNRWSSLPASFSFIIKKPFYKTPLFFILLIGGLIAGFYFFHTYRLQQKLKLEHLRSRISADLHDDIGSTLSAISIISEGALHEKNMSASQSMMKQVIANTQMLMDKMDDIIWCVNPQNDSFQNLMFRVQKFASALFEAKGIDYTISINKSINNMALPMNQRQHIYLILKEAINNLVKYSGATHAEISINYEAGYLYMNVTDNGIGFDAARPQTGNGLRNMQRRAAMLHGTLQIDSNYGTTTVLLRTKIK